MSSWEKRNMAFDMLIIYSIVSLQVPSMMLMVDEKAYHCALVGVPPQGVNDGDDDHLYRCFWAITYKTMMRPLIQNASPAVLHMQGAL